jgi:hypothetical protein
MQYVPTIEARVTDGGELTRLTDLTQLIHLTHLIGINSNFTPVFDWTLQRRTGLRKQRG